MATMSPSPRRTTTTNCLRTCKSNPVCEWFTYTESAMSCVMYSDCPAIDDSCPDCHTGQKACNPGECHCYIYLKFTCSYNHPHMSDTAICGVQGFCDGQIVALDTVASAKECLDMCQVYEDCGWYSYFPETDYCVLTEDCGLLDRSCIDCTAGEKQCYEGEDMDMIFYKYESPNLLINSR